MIEEIKDESGNFEIVHDEEGKNFYLKKDGKIYNLKYVKVSDKVWNFVQASDEDPLDCCGVLDQLTEEVLNYLDYHDIRILANCCSVQHYLMKNKKYRKLIYYPYPNHR